MPDQRLRYALACGALIGAGLVWRLAPLGLPWVWWKYGGAVIWGAMVYGLAGIIYPRRALPLAVLIALGAEFLRLYHTPWLDDFRATFFGNLLLGRVFSLWNIAAYLAGIGAAWGVELYLRGRHPKFLAP